MFLSISLFSISFLWPFIKKIPSMKSFISHFTLLKIFLSMNSFIVLLYILKNFFKNNAYLYTRTFQFITWIFNPSSHTKKIQWTRHGNQILLHIVLKPSLARWVDPGPGRSGAGTGPGWRKNRGRKNPAWPRWPGELTRSKAQMQPVDFCFFTKTMSFWFKKKNWPGQNPESGLWIGLDLKAML